MDVDSQVAIARVHFEAAQTCNTDNPEKANYPRAANLSLIAIALLLEVVQYLQREVPPLNVKHPNPE